MAFRDSGCFLGRSRLPSGTLRTDNVGSSFKSLPAEGTYRASPGIAKVDLARACRVAAALGGRSGNPLNPGP